MSEDQLTAAPALQCAALFLGQIGLLLPKGLSIDPGPLAFFDGVLLFFVHVIKLALYALEFFLSFRSTSL